MKHFKIFLAILLVIFTVFSPMSSTYAAAKEITVTSYLDVINLDKRIVNNGETTVWSGFNSSGYLIPQGTRIFFNVNAMQFSPTDIIVYKKNSSGQFMEIQRLFTTISEGGGTSIYVQNEPLAETGYYAFGLRNYTLSPGTFTGVLMCEYQ